MCIKINIFNLISDDYSTLKVICNAKDTYFIKWSCIWFEITKFEISFLL